MSKYEKNPKQPTPTPSAPPLRQPDVVVVGVSDTTAGVREALARGMRDVGHDPTPEPQPNADAAAEKLLADLLAVLTPLAGTRKGFNGGAVDLLNELVEDANAYRALEALLDPELNDHESEEDALKRIIAASKVDGPTYQLGRSEGRSDVAVEVRQLVDPTDAQHMDGDAALAAVGAVFAGLRANAQEGEDAPRALLRLNREHAAMLKELQPAYDALGPKANARGVIIHHVGGTGPSYDEGGRYGVTYLSVEDGKVTLSPIQEVGRDERGESAITPMMTWGTAGDHLDKAVEDFLRPKAHRS